MKIYRLTHIDNISHIKQFGITHTKSINANKNYISIGDNSIISKRDNKIVNNGSNKLSDYIPFYFGVRMPMLYVIQKGYSKVYKIEAEDIIYCVTTVEQIINEKLSFIFTNGHALTNFSSYYDINHIAKISSILDMEAINSKYWKNDNDLDLQRRKEAEFLLKDDLEYRLITEFFVYNSDAKQKLIRNVIDSNRILIKPEYYF